MEVNLQASKLFYEFLGHKFPVIFQVFTVSKDTNNFLINNIDELNAAIEQWNGKGLLCLAINEHKNLSFEYSDITEITTITFDIDVVKTAKVNGMSTIESKQHAFIKVNEIKDFLETELKFKVNLVVDSGNGFHLYLKLKKPISFVSKEDWENSEDYSKLLFLTRLLQEKFDDDIIHIDNLSRDLNRRMKIPGTLNAKVDMTGEYRLSLINFIDDSNYEQNMLALNSFIVPKTKQAEENLIEKDLDVNSIINSKKDIKLQALLNNVFEKDAYNSRSEAEFALILKLLYYTKDKNKIFKIMSEYSKIGKWNEETDHYREQQFKKAFDQSSVSRNISTSLVEEIDIAEINQITDVVVNELFAVKSKQAKNKNNVFFTDLYKVYKCVRHNNDLPIYIFTARDESLSLGDNLLYLKPINFDSEFGELIENNVLDYNLIKLICKDYSISTKSDDDAFTLFGKIKDFNQNKSVLLQLTTGVDKNNVLELTDEKAKEIVDSYIVDGMHKDERLVLLFKSGLLYPNAELITPEEYQKYNNHLFIVTNSKTGKSTLASAVGYRVEQARSSNLLGFSTSDSTVKGSLDREVKSFYFDEFQEEQGTNLGGHLLGLMETGVANIHKGKKKLSCHSFSSLAFMGNPKREEMIFGQHIEDFTMLSKFESTIKKITTDYDAFGSRIALVVFDRNFTEASGYPLFRSSKKKLKAYVDSLFYYASNNYTKLFDDQRVINFLNTQYDKVYIENLHSIKSNIDLSSIQEFISGQEFSYRHMNGLALKLACVEKIISIIKEEIDVNELISIAENKLEIMKQLNLQSLNNIASISRITEVQKRIYVECFAIENNFNKILLDAVNKYVQSLDNFKDSTIISVANLKDLINENEEVKEKNYSFALVMSRVNKESLLKYGIQMLDYDQIQYLSIKKLTPLEAIFGEYNNLNKKDDFMFKQQNLFGNTNGG